MFPYLADTSGTALLQDAFMIQWCYGQASLSQSQLLTCNMEIMILINITRLYQDNSKAT